MLDSQVSSSATDPAEPVFSSFSPFLPFRPADEPSREPNPSVELTCTSLVPKGSRDPGANSHMAKPSGQDAPPAVAVTNFLYGVSLPTQIAMDLKQEVSSGLHGATVASEVLLPRPSGELKVPSSQEYSDCCGNSLEFAHRRGPGAKPHGAERETFGAGRMGPAGWGWKLDTILALGLCSPHRDEEALQCCPSIALGASVLWMCFALGVGWMKEVRDVSQMPSPGLVSPADTQELAEVP